MKQYIPYKKLLEEQELVQFQKIIRKILINIILILIFSSLIIKILIKGV